MPLKKPLSILALAAVATVAGCESESEKPKISYTANVAPILEYYCQNCHMPGQEGATQSGFLVDSYESIMQGTKYGQVVVPGSAESSTLYRLVAGKADPSIQMPHGDKSLTQEEIDTIKLWIDQGATKG